MALRAISVQGSGSVVVVVDGPVGCVVGVPSVDDVVTVVEVLVVAPGWVVVVLVVAG